MSNEFTERTLRLAIARATAAFRAPCLERKFGQSCTDLAIEISDQKREAGRLSDAAAALEDDAEALRRDAAFELGFAALNAISNLAGAARTASVVAKVIAARSVRGLSRQEIFDLLGAFGPLATFAATVKAAVDLIEAERLADEADRLSADGERLGDELLDAVDRYDSAGCGSGDDLQS